MKQLLFFLSLLFCAITMQAQTPNLTWGKRIWATDTLQVKLTKVGDISTDASPARSNAKLVTEKAAKDYTDTAIHEATSDATIIIDSIDARRRKLRVDTIGLIATKFDLLGLGGGGGSAGTLQQGFDNTPPGVSHINARGTLLSFDNLGIGSVFAQNTSGIFSSMTFQDGYIQNLSTDGSNETNNIIAPFTYVAQSRQGINSSSLILQQDNATLQSVKDDTLKSLIKLYNDTKSHFEYFNNSGLLYSFPTTKPNSGDVLKAADNAGNLVWGAASGGGSSIDTASMLAAYRTAINSNTASINSNTASLAGKVSYSDTSAMLQRYRDSLAGLNTRVSNNSSAINLRVRFADTASMLDAYRNAISSNLSSINSNTASLAGKVNYSDTSAMLQRYRDSLAGLNTRVSNNSSAINLRVRFADTSSMLAAYRTAASTNAANIATNAAAIAALPTIASSTYAPTITSVSNLDASSISVCQWLRVGNIVTVSGEITLDPTAAAGTLTRARFTLPIPSNFGSTFHASGAGYVGAAATSQLGAAIRADATNDQAEIVCGATTITVITYSFSFTYQIL